MSLATIFVLGAGNFGTCLAGHLGKIGHEVIVWHRSAEVLQSIAVSRRNNRYLSEIQLPATVTVANGLEDVRPITCSTGDARSLATTPVS